MDARLIISPEAVAQQPGCAIVDIRPSSERRGALGFIPGSVSLAPAAGVTWSELLTRSYPRETLVVFACTSGRRSMEVVRLAQQHGWPQCRSLTGGVLGWRAAGLPACGVEAAAHVVPFASSEAFVRAVTSCFVAEATETQLDSNSYGDGFDPRGIVRTILAQLPAPSTRVTLERALEQIAEVARQHGHELGAIARNVDRMLAGLEAHP